MFESTLLADVIADGPVFWAGTRLPSAGLTGSTALFDAAGDFRLAPSEHGRYRTVYLVEQDLGYWKQWPLILDEALRLFAYGARGTLFVRFSETDLLSAFAFAAFLRRRSDFTFELEYQDAFPNGTIFYCVRCQREEAIPALASMEFALITDGRRPEAVAHFAASVAAMHGIDQIDWSIAVCGPAAFGAAFANADQRIRYVDAPAEHANRGWITRKKNLIVQTSQANNLLIAHDRYEMPADFLAQLFEFGADFSVIVPAQYDDSGDAYPDWVATGSQWSKTAAGMLEHGDYSPHGFVNGGVIIAKREVLLATPWSDLLFWGQYEDVELSRALTAQGVTPRLARNVRLRVTTSRPGYLNDFARLPDLPGKYVLPLEGANQSEMLLARFPLGQTIAFNAHTTPVSLLQAGIVATGGAWACSPAGLVLLQRHATLALTVPRRGARSLQLCIYMPAYATPPFIIIKANGRALPVRWTETGTGMRCASAALDDAVGASDHGVNLSFVTDADAVQLTALGLTAVDARAA